MADQHNPLVQFSTPIRQGDAYQVVVRLDNPAEVKTAEAVLVASIERLATPIKSLADALSKAPVSALEMLQKKLGAVVIGEAPAPEAAPQAAPYVPQNAYVQPAAPQYTPGPDIAVVPPSAYQAPHQAPQGPPPAWAGQPQAQPYQGGYGQTQAQQAAPSGPCWACEKNAVCGDCQGPTTLISKEIRGRRLNLHECNSGQRHKGMWCKSPIWKSRVAAYLKATGELHPPAGLVYEQ